MVPRSVFDLFCCDEPNLLGSLSADAMFLQQRRVGERKPLTDEERRERQEAYGWTMDAAARGVVVMGSAVFVSSALLRLAQEEAGCNVPLETNYDENEEIFDCKGPRHHYLPIYSWW